ncbi:MAG: DNA gyrase subunit A [Candidatus Cloacimonadota bacterium]|nr:MAG: DNA gyrase subunit A [Candidatus Cloacimonadota bacterium]
MKAGRILSINIEDEVKSSYIDYAMSVIVSRALPDIRDGLKPVHRRILFAMKELGLLHSKPFKKCATVVGDVLGKYHPHGDTAVYDSLVRMVQDFSLRYPLINGQGNFGSVDGDAAAAYRYTEARLSLIAEEMLAEIDKGTVDFTPNFDDRLKEPVVLPSRFPNLLVNGSSGIAVGMATNIPPHNLGEVIDALKALIDEPDIELKEIMKYIKGPDFPTGGIILGKSGIWEAYTTGTGKMTVQGKTHFETLKNGKELIIITEIPYQLNKLTLIQNIVERAKAKKITGIHDLRDESDRSGMRIVIELKRDAQKEITVNQLVKHTKLKQTFGAIFLSLCNGIPKVLPLKEFLQHYIDHRKIVVERRTRFELEKAEARAHILEGFKKALEHIDEIITIIKKSKDTGEAKKKLIERFDFSEIQAQAILDMKLARLTGLERKKIEEEYLELIKKISRFKTILSSPREISIIVKEELDNIKKRFNDERRTEIIESEEEEIELEDLIAEEDVVVTVTRTGYIKRLSLSNYKKQGRGGKGIIGVTTRETDIVEHIFVSSTHNYLLIFTNKGRVYWLKVYAIPEGGRTAKGRAIANLVSMLKDEMISAILPVKDFNEPLYIFIVTKKGIVKRVDLKAFSNPRKGGIIASTLLEDDYIVDVKLTKGDEEILIVTSKGMGIRFKEKEIRVMGRNARGVKGIRLVGSNWVVGVEVARREAALLCASERGFGKRTRISEFRNIHRGGKGVIAMKITEKTGRLIGAMEVTEDDELLLITGSGQIIRIAVNSVSRVGRNTMGVKLINLGPEDRLVDITLDRES